MAKFEIAYIACYDLRRDTAATEHIIQIVNGLGRYGHKIYLYAKDIGERTFGDNVYPMSVGESKCMFFDKDVCDRYLKQREKFDIVYLRDFLGARKVVHWAKSHDVPLVIEHNGLEHIEWKRISNILNYIPYFFDLNYWLPARVKKADLNIVVTGAIGDFLADEYDVPREKFVHIPNGVDIERFHIEKDRISLRKKLGLLPEDAIWFGYIGSMYPWHILVDVVEAFEMVARKIDNVFLLLAGKGPELKKLMKHRNMSKFADRIKIVSPLPIEISHLYISALDVGIALMSPDVAPYCWQVKVNHYAACGVPSVITYDEQFDELIGNNVVWAIKDLDRNNIANYIIRIINDNNFDEIGKKARAYVENNLSWELIVKRTNCLLENVICSEIK